MLISNGNRKRLTANKRKSGERAAIEKIWDSPNISKRTGAGLLFIRLFRSRAANLPVKMKFNLHPFTQLFSSFFFLTVHLCTKRAYCFYFPLTHTSLIPDIFHYFRSLPVTVESPIQKTLLLFVSFGHTHLS